MKIKVKIHQYVRVSLWSAIEEAIRNSRFTASVEQDNDTLTVSYVRLRESKPYCGSHPNGCEARGFGRQRKPAKQGFLEGADWVEFNDLINDVLDSLQVSANVSTSICVIRKGYRRRVKYRSKERQPFIWERSRDEDFKDCCDVYPHPASEFPFGTPGIYRDKYRMEGHPA